jgi:hypothetical protein
MAKIIQGSTETEETYIPVVYSPLISRVPLDYTVFSRKNFKLSLKVARMITKLQNGEATATLWIIKDVKNIDDYVKSVIYGYNNKELDINRLVCIGFIHNGMNVYINDITNDQLQSIDPELAALPKSISSIDYDDINLAISTNRKIPDDLHNLYSEGYYKQHLYKFIKIELLNLIDSGKVKYDRVRQMNAEQLMNLIPHEISENVKTDSNIIISCAKSDLQHCRDGKLLVPPNFKEYCEILEREIHNPVISFITNSRSLVINTLQFKKIPGERIRIAITQD